MPSLRRLSVGGGEVQSEKKRRWSLFRTRTSDNVLAVVTPTDSTGNDGREVVADSLLTSPIISISPSLLPLATSEVSTRATTSAGSIASTSDDFPWRSRAVSPLGRVEEDASTGPPHPRTDGDGLPTYASVTHPTAATTYLFTRTSPFAMVLQQDGLGIEHALYHISVGVNIWIPSCTVTTVRRGSTEDGPIVSQLELGISAAPATILVGDVCKPVNQVFFRKSSTSSTRLYFVGDGTAIKWKLGANVWQAYAGSTLLASFVPVPPRKLTLHPAGHSLSDHVITSIVLLMREHLTPLAGMRGDAAQLFNYSPHYNYHEL